MLCTEPTRTVNMPKSVAVSIACACLLGCGVAAEGGQQSAKTPATAGDRATARAAAAAHPDYVIGAEDVLTVVFWKDKEMSGDFVVRPDGKISLPLLRDVDAAGSTPEELRTRLVQAATKYLEDPDATVVVKEIHSRNIFITG